MTFFRNIPALFLLLFVFTIQAQPNDDFNFMLGDWEVEAKIRQNEIYYLEGNGTMNVYFNSTKDTLYADMNVKFQNFEVIGTTIRTYNDTTGKWDVSWNPESGNAVPNIEGAYQGEHFIEIDYGKDWYGLYTGKLVIYNISDDHFSVRKDKIYDDGVFMKDIWVYEAKRLKEK
ncbi:MAG TPA: hypothetical protein VKN14_06700 [Flavobacteriaceae bacterium]|nr:hypothetical protein [Flavobacteriaceae bacterium]